MHMVEIEPTSSKLWIINFYREQLSKLRKIGVGHRTEHDVLVTDHLIKCTENRLSTLAVVYEHNTTAQAQYQRRELAKRKAHNGQHHSTNGATIKLRE